MSGDLLDEQELSLIESLKSQNVDVDSEEVHYFRNKNEIVVQYQLNNKSYGLYCKFSNERLQKYDTLKFNEEMKSRFYKLLNEYYLIAYGSAGCSKWNRKVSLLLSLKGS